MSTRNFVPRADGEGEIGTNSKRWNKGNFIKIYTRDVDYPRLLVPAGRSNVAVDSSGNFYIVGIQSYNGVSQGILRCYKSTDGGATWQEVGNGFGNLSYTHDSLDVAIDVDNNGLIGVLFKGCNATIPAVYNVYFSLWDGTEWNTVQAVSSETTSGYDCIDLDLCVGGNNVWHAVWAQKHSGSTSYRQIRYCQRSAGDAGTWGSITNIGTAPTAADSRYCNIIVSSDNYQNIVWRDAANSNYNTLTRWNGTGWSTYASTNTNFCYDIVIDSTDKIYLGQGSVYDTVLTVTSAGVWGTITGFGSGVCPYQLNMDSSNNLFAFSVQKSNTPYATSILCKYNGSSWSSGQIINASGYGLVTRALMANNKRLSTPYIFLLGYGKIYAEELTG